MRSAPPVLVPVGRFVWGGRWQVGALSTLSAAVMLVGAGYWGTTVSRVILMGLLWVFASGMAWWLWLREVLPPGKLSWDGQSWWYHPNQAPRLAASVRLEWDMGHAMLLRINCPGMGPLSRYAWLQATKMTAQWHGLRCAVHACDTL